MGAVWRWLTGRGDGHEDGAKQLEGFTEFFGSGEQPTKGR